VNVNEVLRSVVIALGEFAVGLMLLRLAPGLLTPFGIARALFLLWIYPLATIAVLVRHALSVEKCSKTPAMPGLAWLSAGLVFMALLGLYSGSEHKSRGLWFCPASGFVLFSAYSIFVELIAHRGSLGPGSALRMLIAASCGAVYATLNHTLDYWY
jgi:hypothetical protein